MFIRKRTSAWSRWLALLGIAKTCEIFLSVSFYGPPDGPLCKGGCLVQGETRPRTFRSGVLVAEIFWNLKILCHSSPSEPTATHMFMTTSGPVCELAEPSCMNEARGTVTTCFGWWIYDSFGAGFWELREKFQKLVSTQI